MRKEYICTKCDGGKGHKMFSLHSYKVNGDVDRLIGYFCPNCHRVLKPRERKIIKALSQVIRNASKGLTPAEILLKRMDDLSAYIIEHRDEWDKICPADKKGK